MKQLLVFIRKEFYHVFRDRRTLLIMFGLPVVQIILFGFALSSEVKNVHIAVVDYANDVVSQRLIDKIKTSEYLIVEKTTMGYEGIEDEFKKGEIKSALIIPPNFGNDLYSSENIKVQIVTDGSDPNISKTVVNYLTTIINAYQQDILPKKTFPYRIIPEIRMLYNEEGSGSLNFIPGVMALILMIVCTALTSVSVVKEKEMGTMEILLVSPFKPIFVLIAKAIPYLLLSLANFTLILLLAVFLLHVEIKGNIGLLYLESILFIITCLSLGLLISNVTNSQQTALLISLMGMMLPTLIFTGFIMPLENMPKVFQGISHIVPSRWYYTIVKAVMLKGLGFSYIWKETLILFCMTIGLLSIAWKNFKIRL
ncbi:ABC transporter permease [Olivibacter sp. SDN3]|uniref:ABC transporter permease n=1 Tax=Olivibacter sp. SDN3 TaxID=2764720 RepID=UPI001651031A|nr:ABC transporter permease [Olivibacter sp. SDN3]QNL49597.1 ABC transporter permease [Olivibacter sp. SDN3]